VAQGIDLARHEEQDQRGQPRRRQQPRPALPAEQREPGLQHGEEQEDHRDRADLATRGGGRDGEQHHHRQAGRAAPARSSGSA
jgi:hypothetical protein